MAFIVGMDGGGTKTAVIVTHEDQEEPVLSFSVGPINYNGGDAGAIAAAFGEIFNQIRSCCTSLAEVLHVCIGAAGVSNPAVADFWSNR